MSKIETITKAQLKKNLPDVKPGDTVRVYQKIKEKNKERIQLFEGLTLARKHGKGISATITVRKIISGVGVEKIFPLHSPNIEKIEITKRSKVRRAKLYYLRTAKGKKTKLKRKEFSAIAAGEESASVEKAEERKKSFELAEKEEPKKQENSELEPAKNSSENQTGKKK